MKKLSLVIIGLIVISSLAFSQMAGKKTENKTLSKARIKIPQDEFDFGFAPEGHFLSHTYKIENVGEEKLKIKRIRTTCGCTKAPLKRKQLKPGEETEIKLIFNSTRYDRKTSKSAIIYTNDPKNKRRRVTFTANMTKPENPMVEISPRFFDFGSAKNFARKGKVGVKNISEKEVDLKLVDFAESLTDNVKLKNDHLKSGESTELVFRLSNNVTPKKFFKGSITLKLSNKNNETQRWSIPLRGGK